MSNSHRARPLVASMITLAVAAASLVACAPAGPDDSNAPPSGETVEAWGYEFGAPEKTTITIGIPGVTTGGLSMYYAVGAGLFEDVGLDVELVNFQSGAQVTQALLAGQIDAGGADISIMATLARPEAAVYSMILRDNLTDSLFARGDIETADDLRGESIAISSFGSQSYAAALLALDELGLEESDVTITQVGSGSDRLAALLSGAVGASINDPNEGAQAEAQGFHELVSLGGLGASGIVRTSLAYMPAFKAENPNTALLLVAALLKARHDMFENPDVSAQAYSDYTEIPLEEATPLVEVELGTVWLPADGYCSSETVNFMKEVLLTVDPTLEAIDADTACDNSYLDQLAEMGFVDEYSLE